ncbi:nitroreductase family protein [Phenylobacterium deserti]|uniref:Putative NAD(P)H nitroreductase n=1 Tax=Phenylobacterium deserti TaxID=1914756 RepID=A0A328AEC9_9CAUL|nr:nitroreductase [Phenylobacterium deserti]RAK52566.1 nitroreductase [Phenylobacterium deserti]
MTDAVLPPAPEFGAPLQILPSPEVLRFLALRRSAPAVALRSPAPTAAQLQDLIRLAARVPDHGKLAPWRFVVLEGDAKDRFAAGLEQLAQSRGDAVAASKLGKLKIPPLAIAVVSSPKAAAIPEWEQLLSAGAVCTNLTYAASAMGFGANWITDWYSYDREALALLGASADEKVAGFILIGTVVEPPLERERPDHSKLVSRWG